MLIVLLHSVEWLDFCVSFESDSVRKAYSCTMTSTYRKIDSLAPATPASSLSPKTSNGRDDNSDDTMITINENVTLTKNQHQALKIVCDIHQQSFSEYIQEALVQTMKSDIEDGNLSINLLEMLDDEPTGESTKSKTNEGGIETDGSMSVFEELTRLNHLSKPKIPK
jgi:anti-sigma28 factor (negative regulator of flagellin synthesis)